MGWGQLALACRVCQMGRIASVMLCCVVSTAARAASGAEPPGDELPARRRAKFDAAGPPSIPGLSHREWVLNIEYTAASAEPTDVISYEPLKDARAYAFAVRWLLETAIAPRAWYIGLSHNMAAASVPAGRTPGSGGNTLVVGNPELWARGLWSSRSGLSAGGGLGVVIPVPRTFSSLESEVVRAIRVIRPWDFPHFQDLTLTGRPFFDIRLVTGPVTIQMRQGVDFAVLVRDRADNENRYDIQALSSLYVGVSTIEQLTLGLEVQEVYQLTADVSSPSCLAPCDQHRSQVTLSPSLRLHLPRLSPALSVLLPLSTPLRGEVASYYAARLHLDVTFGL